MTEDRLLNKLLETKFNRMLGINTKGTYPKPKPRPKKINKCGWCKKNSVEDWNEDVGVCEDCLNKKRRRNMEGTRKSFNDMNKDGALSRSGLCATDWM